MNMKINIFIALVVGAVISSALLLGDTLTGGGWLGMQMPGIGAAYLFWGAVSSSVVLGMAICFLVNALVYAVPAFAILMIFKLLVRDARAVSWK